MKHRKNIFSILNLIFFLSSFVLLTVNGFSMPRQSQSADPVSKQFMSKQDMNTDGTQQVSEKNESETENDESSFEIPVLTLPFLVSFLQLHIVQPVAPAVRPLAEATIQPIYASVCNFRI